VLPLFGSVSDCANSMIDREIRRSRIIKALPQAGISNTRGLSIIEQEKPARR